MRGSEGRRRPSLAAALALAAGLAAVGATRGFSAAAPGTAGAAAGSPALNPPARSSGVTASPAARSSPVSTPAGRPAHVALSHVEAAVLHGYLGALRRGDYAAAFASLTARERRYFRSTRNFRSVFRADGLVLKEFAVADVEATSRGNVAFVRESVAFIDHARQRAATGTFTVPYALIREGPSTFRVRDAFHPWRAFRSNASATRAGLRVTVRKVSFFARHIEVVATFADLGSRFVTVLQARSVLRDDGGHAYRLLTRRLALTDPQLRVGLRLAPREQYTGILDFDSPQLDDRPRTFTLEIAPALVDGADAPFDVALPGIRPPAD